MLLALLDGVCCFFRSPSEVYFHWQVHAHIRIALSTHYKTALIVFVVGPIGSALASAHSTTGFLTVAVCWLAFSLMKAWEVTRPSAFPTFVRNQFEQAVRANRAVNALSRKSSPPKDLTSDELSLLRFFESVTTELLSEEQRDSVWSMRGGVGSQGQLGFTSIRYHLAFSGYASSTCLSRAPAYTGRLRAILDVLISHMLDERVWCYLDHYWPDVRDPFLCTENVMWSAHVLSLVAMYEAALGDDKFRRPGGLVASRHDPETGAVIVYTSDAATLAAHLAQSMRDNPTGGVPCEPGLVFFQCNNHLMIALRLLEALTSHLPEGAGRLDFRAERQRWERYALESMSTSGGIATAAFKLVSVARMNAKAELATVPFGHLGGDGWCLSYYFAWAETAETPRSIWHRLSKPIFERMNALESPPIKPCCDESESEDGRSGGDGVKGGEPPNTCCCNLNLPVGVWACSLLPAMAQAGDLTSFGKVDDYLRKHYRRSLKASTKGRGDRMWVEETVEWAIGNTATYLFGLALKEGSSLREMVHAPLPPSYFKRALVEEIEAPRDSNIRTADIYRCWREDDDRQDVCKDSKLHVGVRFTAEELPETALTLTLRLANVSSVAHVESEPGDTCSRQATFGMQFDASSGRLTLCIDLKQRLSSCGTSGVEGDTALTLDVCFVICCASKPT